MKLNGFVIGKQQKTPFVLAVRTFVSRNRGERFGGGKPSNKPYSIERTRLLVTGYRPRKPLLNSYFSNRGLRSTRGLGSFPVDRSVFQIRLSGFSTSFQKSFCLLGTFSSPSLKYELLTCGVTAGKVRRWTFARAVFPKLTRLSVVPHPVPTVARVKRARFVTVESNECRINGAR